MADNTEAVKNHEEIVAKTTLFEQHINNLKKGLGSLHYVMIATADGFPVAHTQMTEVEATEKAAMASSLDGLSTTVAMTSELGAVSATHIECEDGFIFSRTIQLGEKKQVVLLVSSSLEENFATVQWHIKKMITALITDFNEK